MATTLQMLVARRIGSAVVRVLTVVAVARAAQFIEIALFPLVAVDRGAGTAGAATVLLALGLGTTAGSPLGGLAVDRAGSRATAALGLATSACAAATLAVAEAVATLALAATVYGIAAAAWRLALEAATAQGLADPGEPNENDQARREEAFGAFVWIVNAGALLSAGAIALAIDLRTAVIAQAVMMGLAAVLAIKLVGSGRTTGATWTGRTLDLPRLPPAFSLLALGYAPFTMVMFQAFSGLAQVFEEFDYRRMVLVNAVTLVVLSPLLWRFVARVEGGLAIAVAGAVQGAGIAAAAIFNDALVTTVFWSAGEATLIAIIPAVVAGIAPHDAVGRYRAAFATVQGGAASAAIFGGPLLANWSVGAFAGATLALTALGLLALRAQAPAIEAGLRQPVRCPCGALRCACDTMHRDCTPSPAIVHHAAAVPRLSDEHVTGGEYAEPAY